MSHRGCPGAASGDSWGQNRLGSRARSETIPRGRRARRREGRWERAPARARRAPVASAGRAEPSGRRAMTGRTGHAGDAPQRGHRGSESDRTARIQPSAAIQSHPLRERVPKTKSAAWRGGWPRLDRVCTLAWPFRDARRAAGRPAPVYTLVSEWMFPGRREPVSSARSSFAGTVRTGEWREGW